jgi:hypothetical protein
MGTDLVEQMASDAPPLRRLQSLALWNEGTLPTSLRDLANSALAEAEAALKPASTDDFRKQLTACLALVAPSGMAENDRNEWLRVAWGTLRDVPPDLLARGCDVARRHCDHPAKIVPTILREIETSLAERRNTGRRVRELLAGPKRYPWEQAEREFDESTRCTPEQAAAIIAELGLRSDAAEMASRHLGSPNSEAA